MSIVGFILVMFLWVSEGSIVEQAKTMFARQHASKYEYTAVVQNADLESQFYVRVENGQVANISLMAGVSVPAVLACLNTFEGWFVLIAAQNLAALYDLNFGYPTRVDFLCGGFTSFTHKDYLKLESDSTKDMLTQNLRAAQQRWRELGWLSYSFRVQDPCSPFCPPTGAPIYTVNVVGDRVTAVLDASGNRIEKRFDTIESLFLRIQVAIDAFGSNAQVSYDSQLGYPTSFGIASATFGNRYEAQPLRIVEVQKSLAEEKKPWTWGQIFGVVVGTAVFICGAIFLTFRCWIKRRSAAREAACMEKGEIVEDTKELREVSVERTEFVASDGEATGAL